MKKTICRSMLSFLLVMLMTFEIFSFVPFDVLAAQAATDASKFTYSETDAGITITSYTGDGVDIVIPEEIKGKKVITLSSNVFSYDSPAENIYIPKSVTTMTANTFQGVNIKSIVIDSENNSYVVNDGVIFTKDMTQLVYCIPGKAGEYAIPDGVQTIGAYAFSKRKELTKVVIPNTVKTIDTAAFQYCTGLTEISIPDSVEKLSDYAFRFCTGISEVVIPGSISVLNYGIFGGCSSLKKLTIENSYSGTTKFRHSIFCWISYYCGSFYDCVNLTEVSLPDTLIDIGCNAFAFCESLENITIPENVTKINDKAFYYCESLNNITIPNNVTEIEERVFFGCSSLKEINIPASVEYISGNAFDNCGSLSSIDVDESNPYFSSDDKGVLFNKDKTKLIRYPAGILSEEYSVPETVNKIGYDAFYKCRNLKKIILTDNITEFGSSAFSYCSSLTEFSIPKNIKTISYSLFYGCSSLEKVLIPDSVETISDYAFNQCSNLKEISLPSNLTKLGLSVFCSSGIKNIRIPDSVTEFSAGVFYSCANIDNIYIPDSVVNISDGDKYEWGKNASIVCNKGSYAESFAKSNNISVKYPNISAFESEHPYSDNSKQSWVYMNSLSTDGLDIVFSEDTCVADKDYIYIYDSNFTLYGKYTSSQLAGQKIHINGDSFIAELNSEGEYVSGESVSDENYGFKIESVNLHVHDFGEWTVTKEPDCYNTGERYRTCGDCGYIDNDILKERHDYADYQTVDKEPACTQTGIKSAHCLICGIAGESVEIPALGHDYKTSRRTDSLTGEGFTVYTCSRCSDSYEIADPAEKLAGFVAVGGIYKVELSWTKAAEASVTGYSIYRKSQSDRDFELLAQIDSRETLAYVDSDVIAGNEYSYRIMAVKDEIAGEFSDDVSAVPTKDTIPPVVTKLFPASGSLVSGSVNVTVTASDNIGIESYVLEISEDGGSTWKKAGESKSNTIVFDTAEYSDETVKVRVAATDKDLNTSDLTPVYSYIIDNTPPEQIKGFSAKSVLSSVITLAWDKPEAKDTAYFILQRKVNGIFTDEAKIYTALGYNLTQLSPDTDYTFRVTAVDNAGNIGEYSEELTVRTLKDTTAPVITSQAPEPGRYRDSIAFKVTAEDDCTVKSITFQTSRDAVTWTDAETVYAQVLRAKWTADCTISLENISDGNIYIRAVASDTSGNVSDTGSSAPYVQYYVDKTAPAAPENVSAEGSDGFVRISWTQGTEDDIGSYSVYRAQSEDGEYSLIASNIKKLDYYDRDTEREVVYYYKVTCTDTCGNMSSYSGAVFANALADTTKPVINSINPSSASRVGEEYNKISVLASDNNLLSEVVIEYKIGDNGEYSVLKKAENLAVQSTVISAYLDLSGVSDGEKIYVRVYCTDIAGLESDMSDEMVYLCDKTAPEVTELSAVNSSGVNIVTWKDNNETDIAGFKIYRRISGRGYTAVGSRSASSNHSYTFSDAVGEGTYTYRIDAVDKTGNVKSFYSNSVTVAAQKTEIKAEIECRSYFEVNVQESVSAKILSDNVNIVSYEWDFGDSTTSSLSEVNKSYKQTGEYIITLKVTDENGNTAVFSKSVTVTERKLLGMVNVKVVDENNKSMSGVPVYFDLGEFRQQIVYTDSNGFASFVMSVGAHNIGVYKSGYLPACTSVSVLSGVTADAQLTLVKQDIISGNFDVREMTFDEITAAGIDVNDPANQQVYRATVTLKYGNSQVPITYIRNNERILSYTVSDSGGVIKTSGTGGYNEIKKIAYIPNDSNAEVIAVIEAPVNVTYLKQFYSATLRIINNSSEEFTLTDCTAQLEIPEGLTLMQYSPIDSSIKGQSESSATWILRGDEPGEYSLTASFNSTLDKFNVPVSASFVSENAVKVRKMSDTVSVVVETPDDLFMQLKEDDDVVLKVKDLAGNVDLGDYKATAFFNVGFKNISDSNIYMPSFSVENITALMRKKTGLDETQTEVKEEAVFIINADSERTEIEDINSVMSLAPGCTIVRYYSVVFNEANELTKKQLFAPLSDITLYGVSDEDVKLETRVDDQLFSMYYYGKIFGDHIHSFKETEGLQSIMYVCSCGYSYSASVSSEDSFDYDVEGQRVLDSLNFDVKTLLSSVTFADDKILGPEINLLGFKFNIFEIDTKLSLPILEKSSIVVDTNEQTIKILIGAKENKKANIGKAEQSNSYWTESYAEVKSFYKAIEGENAPTRDLYNKFRKLRKGIKTNGIDSVGLNFDADLAGYIEFSYKNGLEFSEGGLIASFEMGASITVRPFKIFYASIGLGGGLSGSLKVAQSNQEFTFSGSVTGSINNSYTLGVGDNSILKIYAEGKAVFDLSTTFAFPSASFMESLTMKLTGTLKAKAAFFGAETDEFSYPFLDYQIYPKQDDNKNKVRRKSLKSSNSVDFTPISRDYSQTSEISANEFTLAKNDLYPYSTPSVVTLSDGREAMFWIDDNAEKQAINRTDIYYSIFDNGTWSSPCIAFESEGFCDRLKTAYDSNGVYLLFAMAPECDENADYTERVNSSELYCSYFDGAAFSEPDRITDNDRAEIGYSIEVSDSAAKIAYVTNSENDYFDSTGIDTVTYIEFNNSNVSEIFSYEFNGISSMDVSPSSDSVYVVSSENDNVIYSLDSSGKSSVYEGENSVDSLCAADGGLFFVENAQSMYYNGTSAVFAGLIGITNLSSFAGVDGTYTLITNVNESNCGTLYACKFNASNFDYGSAYPVFSQSGKFIREYGTAFDSDGDMCVCVNAVEFCDDGTEVSNLTVINTNEFVDISVDDLYVDYSSFSDDGLIYADITNRCSSEISTFNVSVSDENGNAVSEMQIRTAIKPGETVTERIRVNAEEIEGKIVYVTVTPDRKDGNISDNTASTNISDCDVFIKDVKIAIKDDKAYISGNAENTGTRSTENTVISLKELNSTSSVSDVLLGSIASGEEKAFSLEIPNEYFESDNGETFRMILSACVNSGEKNYSNNIYEFSYSSIYAAADEKVCINHNYILTKESESSCIKHGEKVFTCKNCGEIKTETQSLGSHSESDWVTDVKPDCLNAGSEYIFCTVCGERLETRTLEKTGHTPSDWIVEDEASCVHEGMRHKECIDCMTVLESEVIPTLAHVDENSDGICDSCGESINVDVSCSHICHKRGFARIIWKIIRIIYKVFRTNKYCECGAEHY